MGNTAFKRAQKAFQEEEPFDEENESGVYMETGVVSSDKHSVHGEELQFDGREFLESRGVGEDSSDDNQNDISFAFPCEGRMTRIRVEGGAVLYVAPGQPIMVRLASSA
jgi:hypothetical protein